MISKSDMPLNSLLLLNSLRNGLLRWTNANQNKVQFSATNHSHKVSTSDKNNSPACIKQLISHKQLSARFQPIVDLNSAQLLGHEALIRGPQGSLHTPDAMLAAAKRANLMSDFELNCHQTVLSQFANSANTPKKVFINAGVEYLSSLQCMCYLASDELSKLGLSPKQIVIEITEQTAVDDFKVLRKAIDFYRELGFEISLDDLGEGFSGLRLWSELQPNYVKIDKHFTHDIHRDALKQQFVKSIQEIAQNSGAHVIAEGIETLEQLEVMKQLEVKFGQGYMFGKPEPQPLLALHASTAALILRKAPQALTLVSSFGKDLSGLRKFVRYVAPINAGTTNEKVLQLFEQSPNLYAIPVVDGVTPIGLISRYDANETFAKRFSRELYSMKPCETLMAQASMQVDVNTSLQDLSEMLASLAPQQFFNGFIVTLQGRYLGMITGHDLLREVLDTHQNALPPFAEKVNTNNCLIA